jgi:hypothetical protein
VSYGLSATPLPGARTLLSDGMHAERARKAIQSKQGGGGEGRGVHFARERRWDLFGDPRVYSVPTARLSSSHPLSMP